MPLLAEHFGWVSVEDFSGTDTQKLSAAVDHAVANGRVLVIPPRTMTLTGWVTKVLTGPLVIVGQRGATLASPGTRLFKPQADFIIIGVDLDSCGSAIDLEDASLDADFIMASQLKAFRTPRIFFNATQNANSIGLLLIRDCILDADQQSTNQPFVQMDPTMDTDIIVTNSWLHRCDETGIAGGANSAGDPSYLICANNLATDFYNDVGGDPDVALIKWRGNRVICEGNLGYNFKNDLYLNDNWTDSRFFFASRSDLKIVANNIIVDCLSEDCFGSKGQSDGSWFYIHGNIVACTDDFNANYLTHAGNNAGPAIIDGLGPDIMAYDNQVINFRGHFIRVNLTSPGAYLGTLLIIDNFMEHDLAGSTRKGWIRSNSAYGNDSSSLPTSISVRGNITAKAVTPMGDTVVDTRFRLDVSGEQYLIVTENIFNLGQNVSTLEWTLDGSGSNYPKVDFSNNVWINSGTGRLVNSNSTNTNGFTRMGNRILSGSPDTSISGVTNVRKDGFNSWN